MRYDLLGVLALLVLCVYCASVHGAAKDTVVYAPDIVGVDRMFMIALRVPTDTPEVEVAAPACVKMFDRTPLPAKSDVRRFYFRSVEPAKQAAIRFRVAKQEVLVPVVIWSFDDLREFRKLKGTQLGANIIGGILFGGGWALMGFCPGTSVGAITEGRWHAIWAVIGMLIGAALFAELYPAMQNNLLAWGDLGKIPLPGILHIHPWVAVPILCVIYVAVLAFFEKKGF